MKKIIIVIIFALLFIAAGFSDTVFDEYDESLGGQFSSISGVGLSYQRWFGKIGLQVGAGGFYAVETPGYTDFSSSPDPATLNLLDYNVGIGVQYMLFEDSFSDWFDACLYIVGGLVHFGYVENRYTYSDVANSTNHYDFISKTTRYIPGLGTGFGIGFEFVFIDHISIPIEIALNGAWTTESWVPEDAGIKVHSGFRYRY
ncbi:MAG: hypothetical protein PQJ61_12230 [Spirochaetales bacterium]|uniref:Uncharacterized protein n=1 Tax=Candidatus Thalassospirochaeta sargassi TaxID=3119039 RepID=A0AAJ1MJH9_9SPIO|nr:hypothetical protein [Spirochaetales bacterium]